MKQETGKPGGYEQTYYLMRGALRTCDFTARARELGLNPPDNGALSITFLGRGYSVDGNDVTPVDSIDTSAMTSRETDAFFNARTVIIYYLTHGGTGEPNYDFRPIRSFAHGLFDGDRGIKWDAANGGDNLIPPDVFDAAALRTGAEFVREKNGARSYLVRSLPKVPALLTFTQGDDEFPDDVNVKFGANATDFLPFETLAVYHGLILRTVMKHVADIK